METYYKHDNIEICSFLLTNPNIHLVDIVEENPHHYYFLLSNPELCNELKQQFLNNASAPAMELFSKRELLISEIKHKEKNRSFNNFQKGGESE